MEEIKITRRMLSRGMQGRIKVREVDRFNKKVRDLKIEIEKRLAKKDKPKKPKKFIEPFSMEKEIDEEELILGKPKLRRVRSYEGWW